MNLAAQFGLTPGAAFLAGFIILWVLVPIAICGRLTLSKGNGYAMGAILGLILGWLGVLLCLVMPYKPRTRRRRRRIKR